MRALVRATAPSAVWRAPELRGLLTAAIRVEFLIAVIALALLMVVILVISAPSGIETAPRLRNETARSMPVDTSTAAMS